MNIEPTKLGNLNCIVMDLLPEGKSPDLLVVLCHGFGAPGDDLAGLGPEILRREPGLAEHVRFVFPEAPLSLDSLGMYGGRAWWHLDIAAFNAAIESGNPRILRDDKPEGLTFAQEMLTELVTLASEKWNVPLSRTVLGGFSQGSMVATEVTLRLPESIAGLCVFSGTLINEKEWKELAPAREGLPVLQSHGRQDPILPFVAAELLRDLLTEAKLDVQFIPFAGPHTIPLEALEAFCGMLSTLTTR